MVKYGWNVYDMRFYRVGDFVWYFYVSTFGRGGNISGEVF